MPLWSGFWPGLAADSGREPRLMVRRQGGRRQVDTERFARCLGVAGEMPRWNPFGTEALLGNRRAAFFWRCDAFAFAAK